MKRNLVESSKIMCHKNRPLVIAGMAIFLIVTNLQSFIASAFPRDSSATYNSNISNNTAEEKNNLNNTLIENDRMVVRLSPSTENQSNGLQNASILNDSNKNPRDDLNCYTEGLYVCNESGECDNIKFDCLTECHDGITRTTGTCPNDDDKICWIKGEYICNNRNDTAKETPNRTRIKTDRQSQKFRKS